MGQARRGRRHGHGDRRADPGSRSARPASRLGLVSRRFRRFDTGGELARVGLSAQPAAPWCGGHSPEVAPRAPGVPPGRTGRRAMRPCSAIWPGDKWPPGRRERTATWATMGRRGTAASPVARAAGPRVGRRAGRGVPCTGSSAWPRAERRSGGCESGTPLLLHRRDVHHARSGEPAVARAARPADGENWHNAPRF